MLLHRRTGDALTVALGPPGGQTGIGDLRPLPALFLPAHSRWCGFSSPRHSWVSQEKACWGKSAGRKVRLRARGVVCWAQGTSLVCPRRGPVGRRRGRGGVSYRREVAAVAAFSSHPVGVCFVNHYARVDGARRCPHYSWSACVLAPSSRAMMEVLDTSTKVVKSICKKACSDTVRKLSAQRLPLPASRRTGRGHSLHEPGCGSGRRADWES